MSSSQHPASKPTLRFARGWSVEIDLPARKLAVVRESRWPALVLRKIVVSHCTFDECSAVGTVPNNFDDPGSYGVYLDFRGGREVIPAGALGEAARLAAELSVATGIPRLDADRWHRLLW